MTTDTPGVWGALSVSEAKEFLRTVDKAHPHEFRPFPHKPLGHVCSDRCRCASCGQDKSNPIHKTK